MTLESLLNNPNRVKNKLTGRNRIQLLESEIKLAREKVVLILEGYYHTELKPGILSIVGTNAAQARQALGYYLNQDKLDKWIILAAGRSGRYDEDLKAGKQIRNFVISAEDILGPDLTKTLADWLEVYLVLCDGEQICSTPKAST